MNTEDFIDFFQMKKELSLSGIYLGNNGFLCFVRVGDDIGGREEGGAFLLSCQVDKVTVDLLASIVWREVGVRQEASVVTEEEGSSRIHSGSSGKLQNTQEQQWSLNNHPQHMWMPQRRMRNCPSVRMFESANASRLGRKCYYWTWQIWFEILKNAP